MHLEAKIEHAPFYDIAITDLYDLPAETNVPHPEYGSTIGSNFRSHADGQRATYRRGEHSIGTTPGCGLKRLYNTARRRAAHRDGGDRSDVLCEIDGERGESAVGRAGYRRVRAGTHEAVAVSGAGNGRWF